MKFRVWGLEVEVQGSGRDLRQLQPPRLCIERLLLARGERVHVLEFGRKLRDLGVG